MEVKELYEEYGKLSIQLEAIQAKMLEIKRKIIAEINGKHNNPSKG